MSYPLVIEEVNGLKRSVILRGTSRPFKPIELGVEMRMTTTHYSGNKVGFQRVSGAKFTDLAISGRWDDKRLGPDDKPKIAGFGDLLALFGTTPSPGGLEGSAGMAGGSVAQNTAEICAVMQSILTAGARLRVEWGRHVRFGRMRRFAPRWKTSYEAEWEMEFEWIGDQQEQPVPAKGIPSVSGFLETLSQIIGDIQSVIAELGGYLSYVLLGIGELQSLVQKAIDTINLIIDVTLIPSEALSALKVAYESIRLQAEEIIAQIEARTAGLNESIQRDPGGALLAVIAAREVQRYVEILMEESMLRQAEIEQALGLSTQAVFTVPDWMSLRDVSIQFYGTPDSWQVIASANAIPGSVVRAGTELRIPRIT